VEGGGDRLDRQVGQDLLAEKSGPGSVEEFAPFGFQVGPRVEKRASGSVPNVEDKFSCNVLIFKENCINTTPGVKGKVTDNPGNSTGCQRTTFCEGVNYVSV
jgi:hypothetical protein